MAELLKAIIAFVLALIGVVVVGASWLFLYESSTFGQALALMLVVIGAIYLAILLFAGAYALIED
jgi:type IV secretory pathway VirB2 component (pilin)